MAVQRGGVAILFACSTILLHAQDGTSSISGTLQFSNGALEGGSVVLKSASGAVSQTSVDAQGFFRFSGLEVGRYTLGMRRLAFYGANITLDLRAGEQKILPPIRLSMAPTGDCFPVPEVDPDESRFPLAGPSLGGFGGSVKGDQGPIVGARVLLECWLGECRGEGKVAMTDSGGAFVFENLRPGPYTLSVERAGFLSIGGRFNVAGGLESIYSFELTPCPNGNCVVRPDPNVKLTVCE
jgi:hypothetical protein